MSEKIMLRAEDIGPTRVKFNPNNPKHQYKPKSYNPQYIWGQLSFWDRQTIKTPDASLTAARYGTCVIPDVGCCFRSSQKVYNRKDWLRQIEEKPYAQWPNRWHWSYRNPHGIYGSVAVDHFLGVPGLNTVFEQMNSRKVMTPRTRVDEFYEQQTCVKKPSRLTARQRKKTRVE